MAAASVGLCESVDAGATWATDTDGLHATYARAVAFDGESVLVSVSDGPFAAQSAIYRRPVAGGGLERVADGLPEWLAGNVDTACLATGRGQAALADGDGDVWARTDPASGWRRLAGQLGSIHAVAVA